jgi:hypothetical protein
MGEWSVEVRTQSAYLAGSGYKDWTFGAGPEPRHTPRVLWTGARPAAFTIPTEDAGKVLAALDQILTHPAYARYLEIGQASSDFWWAEQHEDRIRLFGPFIAFGSRAPWAPHRSVELHYCSLADLRKVLANFAGSLADTPVPVENGT